MSGKFIDDEIIHIESDIKKIQIKPTVYISHGGEQGAGHLCKEGINNSIDECMNPNGVGDTVYIEYIEETDTIQIGDNGRGIPFESLAKSCTLLQAGSKSSRETGGSSAGENGIGMTAMNALSEVFEIDSYRYGECKVLRFRDGDLIVDRVQKMGKDKHGLTIIMKPSKTFLGSEARIPIDYLEEWIQKISFIIPENIKIKFSSKRINQELNVNKTFKNMDGLKGYLKTICPKANLFRSPIVLLDRNSIMEKDVTVQKEDGTIISVDLMRDIELTIAMNYQPNGITFDPHSFCNIIENIQHGMHHLGVKQAYLNYIKKQVKESLTKKESHYEVTDNDVLNGLSLIVNLNTTHSTGFSPQTKEFLGNQALLSPIRSLASKMFNEFFRGVDGKKYLTSIIKVVKANIEMRMSLTKTRNKVKATTNFLDERGIKGYTPPNKSGKNDYRELYIVEGESAGGGGRGGRYNNDVQGLLELRGKINNILKKSPHEAIKAEDIQKILKILKCGHDDHYSEENLYFDKVIIFTDADVDGDHIAGLILLLFTMRCPQLIENGHVYRAMTPLYKIRSKGGKKNKDKVKLSDYIYDKKEFFKLYEKYVSEKIKIKVNEDDSFSTSAQMAAFLAVNKEYYEVLDTLSRHYSCDMGILEFIARNIDTYQDTIHELDPELKYVDGAITGIYEGRYNNIIINTPLMKQLTKMNNIIMRDNNGNAFYYMYESYMHKSNALVGRKTIGEIMERCSTMEPPISTRFKGLGELDPKDLSELGLNPKNRKLIQLTMDDAQEAVNRFLIIFGDKQMDEKKKLFMSTEVSMEDLDN